MPPGYGSIDASNQSKDSQENGEKREEQLQNLFDGNYILRTFFKRLKFQIQ